MSENAHCLTRPTPARRDAPFTGQGHSEQEAETYAVGTLRS